MTFAEGPLVGSRSGSESNGLRGGEAELGELGTFQSSPRCHEAIVFGAGAGVSRGPQLYWSRIGGIAVALIINGFAALYVSLPADQRVFAHVPVESVQGVRRALMVELVANDPIPVRISVAEPEAQRAVRQSRSVPVIPTQVVRELDAAPMSIPHAGLDMRGAIVIDEAAESVYPANDPKAAAAVLYRRPALTYEPTRFNDAWRSKSLAARARQSTFSYALFCSLNDEMRQIRGCSRDERNAAAAASRGDRIDIHIRPDAAVD